MATLAESGYKETVRSSGVRKRPRSRERLRAKEGRVVKEREERVALVVFLSVLFLLSGMALGSPDVPRLSASVATEPLSISFTWNGTPVTALWAEGRSALYLTEGKSRVDLVGAPKERREGEATELIYATSDGRTATVTIAPAEEGACQVRFVIEGKGEFEKLGAAFRVGAEEGFYGLMERVVQGGQGFSWKPGMTEGFDLRGQTVDLYVLPTVAVYSPFYVSSAGYGVYVESDWPGTYRFGVTANGRTAPTEVTLEYEGPELVLRVIPGPTPLEATERYSRTVGTSLLPPRFAFGPLRWRDEIFDLSTFYDGTPYDGPYNSMVVEDVLMMEALGIPCSMYEIDRPWALGFFGYGDMEVDPERLPDFDGMVRWLEEKGIHTLLWAAPWVADGMRAEAEAKSYTVKNTIPYLPQAANVDFTNPDAVSWWQDALTGFIERGIAGFKLDRGEEKNPDGQLFRGSYFDGTSYREGHNAYPLWFAQAGYGAFARAGESDSLNLLRAGWVGTSRYAIVWGGDTDPSEWGLRSAIIAVERAAAINFPIWGSDTGGYSKRPPREVLGRWLGFSAFTPLMEVGPTANLGPWSWLPDGSEDEISERGYPPNTVYDAELLAIWNLYANLHNDLADYTYEQARLAHERGTPIVRPMVFAYPDHPEYRDLFEQYLFGPDLLVRPVWKTGTKEVTVHIPDGVWIDAWTRKEIAGPTVITASAPLHVIPIYVRKGSAVDLGDLSARWTRAVETTRTPPDLALLARSVE
jgi:alpha-glucosidase (family GH31 glycosyl hydrolase)